jgi:hypothetical protein
MHCIVNVFNGDDKAGYRFFRQSSCGRLTYLTREKNIGLQSTIFLHTLDEPFITALVMAIAPTRLYLVKPMPTGLVNSKNENQPLVFYSFLMVGQYHMAVDVNEQRLYLPEMPSFTHHVRTQKNPSGLKASYSWRSVLMLVEFHFDAIASKVHWR